MNYINPDADDVNPDANDANDANGAISEGKHFFSERHRKVGQKGDKATLVGKLYPQKLGSYASNAEFNQPFVFKFQLPTCVLRKYHICTLMAPNTYYSSRHVHRNSLFGLTTRHMSPSTLLEV